MGEYFLLLAMQEIENAQGIKSLDKILFISVNDWMDSIMLL